MTSSLLVRAAAALVCVVIVASCRGSAPEEYAPMSSEDAWSPEANAEAIVAASCPDGAGDGFAMSFLVDVEPVALGAPEDVEDALDGLQFAGGWALSAAPGSFGGLSGLKVLASGDLLAVSDAGAFVEIGFDQDDLVPTGQATLEFLRGEDGEMLTGKDEADSEGLELAGALALVSFERDHRVMAFARDVCGSNARGVLVSELMTSQSDPGFSIRDNAGAEGLAMLEDRVLVGLETIVDSLSPVGVIDASGMTRFAARRWIDGDGLPLVGLEASGRNLLSLHRAYNPLTGNSIAIHEHRGDGENRVLARLSRPLAVDNFEGIAARQEPDGTERIFIIADDNFSDGQRTLLYVFERSR